MKKITICMGSSCFSRGNNTNLKMIQTYLDQHNKKAEIELTGALCQGQCSKGPVIFLGETLYTQVEPNHIKELLSSYL